MQLAKNPNFGMKKGIEDSIEEKYKKMMETKRRSAMNLSHQSKAAFKAQNKHESKIKQKKLAQSIIEKASPTPECDALCRENQEAEECKIAHDHQQEKCSYKCKHC